MNTALLPILLPAGVELHEAQHTGRRKHNVVNYFDFGR